VDLGPLIARIRKELGGGDRVTATAVELAQFVRQIIDLTLAEVSRGEHDEKIAPRNSGNAVDFGMRGPPQEKPR